MPEFRKRPVVVGARQCPRWEDAAAHREIASWCRARYGVDEAGEYMVIDTLEGAHKARPGDWIIKGVAGEFYPCKPDIFAATYEPAEAATPAEGDRERAAGLAEVLHIERLRDPQYAHQHFVDAIAAALAEARRDERERCAKVADDRVAACRRDWQDRGNEHHAEACDRCHEADVIAAAIREQP